MLEEADHWFGIEPPSFSRLKPAGLVQPANRYFLFRLPNIDS